MPGKAMSILNYGKELWAASAGTRGQALMNMGKYAGHAAGGAFAGRYGRTVQGAAIGGAAGAAWGMASSDTSVLGGAMMGAGMGAGLARYGGAGLSRAMRSRAVETGRYMNDFGVKSMGSAFYNGVKRTAVHDFGRAKVAANNGWNKIKGLWN